MKAPVIRPTYTQGSTAASVLDATQEEDMSHKTMTSVARVLIEPRRGAQPSTKAIREAARDVATSLSKDTTAATILSRLKTPRRDEADS